MLQKIAFILIGLMCLFPFIPAALALFMGLVFALIFKNPYQEQSSKYAKLLLAISIVGLGAGMNLSIVLDAGIDGFFFTLLNITFAILTGVLLGRLLKVENNIMTLITFGSAICGGSAIAAMAPVIKAKEHEITVALGVVFSLNALALIIFPFIGELLELSQQQFGLWAALAIHDTSSVVGASMQYGEEALEVGTTVKLVRALWIIPLVFAMAFWMAHKEKRAGSTKDGAHAKIKLPWFILGFIAMTALVTFVPASQPVGDVISYSAKRLLVLTLFLIGAGLSIEALKQVGFRPFLHGVVLWVGIMLISLIFIINTH